MCLPTLSYAEAQVQAESASRTVVYSDWMLVYGATSLITTVGLDALETNFGATVTWRTANVTPTVPNAWQSPYPTTAGAAYGTNNTQNPHTFDVTTAATTAMYVQAAASTVLTTGSASKEAFLRLWASLNTKAFLVASQRIEINPGLGTDTVVAPIGKPFPCAGLTGLMFALTFSGVSGTITPTPGWRSFDGGDLARPNGWNAFTALSNVSANTRVNSGHNAITPTDKLLAQAGFQFATSGTNPKAIVDILVAARIGLTCPLWRRRRVVGPGPRRRRRGTPRCRRR